jgi:divalent metal cation (Fe/Co/Zn/Cd) transporter
VIAVSPGAAVGQGHEVADRVEAALERTLPGADVVVHVEPAAAEGTVQDRILAAATSVPQVREVHNLQVIDVGDGDVEASLHLKLPGDMQLEAAHGVAEQVERAVVRSVPEVTAVQTHIEPLDASFEGRDVTLDEGDLARRVVEAAGEAPRSMRLLGTADGVVVYLTLALDAGTTLADAHRRASAVEERVRAAVPGIGDVIVHTEP